MEDYHECLQDLKDLGDVLQRRTKHPITFIQQGSSCVGFSTNPLKGRRFLPTHVYQEETSDTDFRFFGTGLAKIAEEGGYRSTSYWNKYGVMKPKWTTHIFPETRSFIQKWTPRIRGRRIQLIPILRANTLCTLQPWDLPC